MLSAVGGDHVRVEVADPGWATELLGQPVPEGALGEPSTGVDKLIVHGRVAVANGHAALVDEARPQSDAHRFIGTDSAFARRYISA